MTSRNEHHAISECTGIDDIGTDYAWGIDTLIPGNKAADSHFGVTAVDTHKTEGRFTFSVKP